MHGGQESTLLTMMVPLLHHGCVLVGIPFTEPALNTTRSGGTPYGASHVALLQDDPEPSDEEALLARALGRRLAMIAPKHAGAAEGPRAWSWRLRCLLPRTWTWRWSTRHVTALSRGRVLPCCLRLPQGKPR